MIEDAYSSTVHQVLIYAGSRARSSISRALDEPLQTTSERVCTMQRI